MRGLAGAGSSARRRLAGAGPEGADAGTSTFLPCATCTSRPREQPEAEADRADIPVVVQQIVHEQDEKPADGADGQHAIFRGDVPRCSPRAPAGEEYGSEQPQ